LFSVLGCYFLVIGDALLVLFAHHHLFADSLASLALLLFRNVSLASVSELGEEVLPKVDNHHLHQFCLVLLQAHPIFPPLEARSRRFRVIALKVISQLLVGLLLQRCLEVIDVLAQSGSLLFMFTNLLILSIYNIGSVVLHRLEVRELLTVCVDSPQLDSLLLLTLVKVLKDTFPVSPCYFMMMSECTECLIMFP